MLGAAHIATVFYLLALPFAASAASLADIMTPELPNYYEDFDPGLRPWRPGEDLNVEEIYKNYQYYEIVLNRDGREITVNEYIKGDKTSSEKYIVLPDGSLQKK